MTKNNELKLVEERNLADTVLNRVINMQVEGSLEVPANYSAGNALKAAFLILQDIQTTGKKPVLEACTKQSIMNTLLDMVVQGLDPVKQQCYFIPYGDQLTLSRSYLGTIALTKRIPGVKDVKGYAIYEDDELELGFDYINARTTIEKYKPSINRDPNKLIGALGVVVGTNEILHVEYMDLGQIKSSWNQGAMKGNSPAHKNFSDQMAIKTVINRACKLYAKGSDDDGKVTSLLDRMTETDREVEAEIETNANKINLDDAIVDEETGEEIINEDIEGQESMPF